MTKPLLPLFAVALCLALPVRAATLSDPFATEAVTPPQPSPQSAGRSADVPCARELPAAPLTAVDAVNLTLCNNPQTREVWAAARFQAAQVGVAQAAWLPNLDGRLGASRLNNDGRYYNANSAVLTLSWLVFDSGARSASGENARQLLAAAAATQDATVQSLFLSALQAFYFAQATKAAVVFDRRGRAGGARRFQRGGIALQRRRRDAGRPPAGADRAVAGDAQPDQG